MSNPLRRIFSLTPFRLSILLIAIMVVINFMAPSLNFLQVLEAKALDLRFTIRGVKKPGPSVVIATIDEKAVDKIGRLALAAVKDSRNAGQTRRTGAQSHCHGYRVFRARISTPT